MTVVKSIMQPTIVGLLNKTRTKMNHVKTVKRFVAGSHKLFDIYECTVDEVEKYTSATSKEMVKLTIAGKEYSGLHNKWVYEYLCENEGSPSFVVLWRAPKGEPMVAYVKEVWQDHIKGEYNVEVPNETEAYNHSNQQAFCYMWVNKDDDRKYIGMHTGKPDDGYVCSSSQLLDEHGECPTRFLRTILAYGSTQEMLELETMLLLQLKTTMSPLYYNLSNNLRK
jgi:hypothetical protein